MKIIMIILISILVYANSFQGQYVSDDYEGMATIGQMNFSNPQFFIRGNLHKFFGDNPVPYHVASTILNSLACVLVFLLLKKFFSPVSALLGTCFFIVHPLHTEAVAWISGDGYVINCIFYLGILLIYDINIHWYIISLCIFGWFASLMFPWILLVAPLVLVYEFTRRGIRKLYLAIPYFIISGIVVYNNSLMVKARIISIESTKTLGSATMNPFVQAIHSIANNFVALFYPHNLSLYHEPLFLSDRMLMVETAFFLYILAFVPLLYKEAKPLFLGLMFFFVGIAFSLSPKPVAWLLADRYMYFSVILLSFIVAYLYSKTSKYGNIVLAVLFILFLGYSFRTVARNEDYRTNRRFWEETVKQSPLSPRSHNELGRVFFQEGNLNLAIQEFYRSTQLSPTYAIAWNNLANSFEFKGEFPNAVKCYEEAIKNQPDLFQSNLNVGIIYLNSDMFKQAVERLTAAHKSKPLNKDVIKALDLAQRGLSGEKLIEIKKGVK